MNVPSTPGGPEGVIKRLRVGSCQICGSPIFADYFPARKHQDGLWHEGFTANTPSLASCGCLSRVARAIEAEEDDLPPAPRTDIRAQGPGLRSSETSEDDRGLPGVPDPDIYAEEATAEERE